ncbi:transcriptional initiation protein Tat [Actinomyces procaprae]|uniref:transcriptional initiation protein Tat n=1 Tax=Actinomyces procaprae TaxID=2560010 RepID=UPI0010A29023|nr:transcriptional initiation protein Tat [Actinomyces procaprae]
MAACQSAHRLGPGVSRRTAIGAALLGLAGSGAIALTGCAADQGVEKPVLYIYPETTMDLSVRLDYDGELTHLYPDAPADGGRVEWEVTARPDGVLTDSSGRSYPYLFWEGRSRPALSQEAGAVVAAADANRFLEELAAATGLNDLEAADLITYWAPRIAAREQTLVTVATEQYAAMARYTLTDAAGREIIPDTFIRLYLVIGDAPSHPVPEQEPPTPMRRTGFTLVEWGGSEL